MKNYEGIICRGSIQLGSHCGKCEKCLDEFAEMQAIKQYLAKPAPIPTPCGCIGPQGDDPVCPCAMRFVENVNGKYYQISRMREENRARYSAREL